MKFISQLVILSTLSLILGSCGLPTTTFVRSEKIVAHSAGESVPVNIRFFQLSHWKKFREADLNELWTDPSTILGEDLLGEPFEFTVHASSAEYVWDRTQKIELPPWPGDCNYLAVILLSAQAPKKGSRRAIMASKDANSYDIVVDNGTINLVDR